MENKKQINNVTLQLRSDSLEHWNVKNPILLKGEIGIVFSNNSTTTIEALVIGDSFNTVSNILQNQKGFYPGIGAGYVLPTASSDTKGGLQLDDRYFQLVNEQLQPKLITLTVPYNLPDEDLTHTKLTTPENCDLRVLGNLYAESMIFVEKDDLKVNTNFIEVHKKIEGSIEPEVLGNNEYAGIRIYNYHIDDADLEEASRKAAEIAIDNKGKLFYTLDEEIERQLILTIPPIAQASGKELFLKTTQDSDGMKLLWSEKISPSDVETKPLKLTIGGEELVVYDTTEETEVTIDIPEDYCESIIVNGQTYEAVDHVITLGETQWTDEYKNKLESALQSLTVNEVRLQSNNVGLNIAESDLIEVTQEVLQNESTIELTLNHKKPTSYTEQITGYEELDILSDEETVIVISDIKRDEVGHTISYNRTQLKFKDMRDRIADLEQRVLELENIINSL